LEKPQEPAVKVLFVGNSYTARNDLPGIYRELLKHDSRYADKPVKIDSVTHGGYRLIENANDLNQSV
ncbi:MAG: hypothetical protein ABEI13_03485, partial [Candidatus Paceibacteria bacterium]